MAADSGTQSRQRADAYGFLASLFGNPVDAQTLKRIADFAAATPEEEAGIAADVYEAFVGERDWEALSERLAVEHAKLFLGLRKDYAPPPPYESLWREDRIMGDSTLAVASAYSEAGFDDKGPWGPCDHIAYELRFMASLCQAEAEAEQGGQSDEAEWARLCQARFLDEHLLAWVPEYCRRLADQAEEPLYVALARVTAQVLAEDATAVRSVAGAKGGVRTPLPAADLRRG